MWQQIMPETLWEDMGSATNHVDGMQAQSCAEPVGLCQNEEAPHARDEHWCFES